MPSIPPKLQHLDSFTVTGFMIRTQNSFEFSEKTAKLPQLWQQFYSSKYATDTTIFGVYSDYESDENSFYNVTSGIASERQDKELSTVKINSGNYLVFRGKGEMPQTVIDTWKLVWAYFTSDSPYQRCFMSDFEAYSNGDEVAVYIGIK